MATLASKMAQLEHSFYSYLNRRDLHWPHPPESRPTVEERMHSTNVVDNALRKAERSSEALTPH
jgi:hypothetical protein